jgi:hypothetical protein
MDENRNTMSACFGFSPANYELDDITQLHKPAIKCNMKRYAGETMLLLGELLDKVDLNGHFHKVNNQRQRNYAARIGINCKICQADCSNGVDCGNNFLICISWICNKCLVTKL